MECPKPRVYIASKLKHYAKWRHFRHMFQDINFVSRWFDEKHLDQEINAQGVGSCSIDPETAKRVWIMDENDVQRAHYCIVYAEEGEHLRGALVEAGLAIAYGAQVIVIGEHLDYGTWSYHPNVKRMQSVEDALSYINMK